MCRAARPLTRAACACRRRAAAAGPMRRGGRAAGRGLFTSRSGAESRSRPPGGARRRQVSGAGRRTCPPAWWYRWRRGAACLCSCGRRCQPAPSQFPPPRGGGHPRARVGSASPAVRRCGAATCAWRAGAPGLRKLSVQGAAGTVTEAGREAASPGRGGGHSGQRAGQGQQPQRGPCGLWEHRRT